MTEVVAGSSTTDPEILDVQQQGDQIILQLRVQPELCWFDGHFPEVPLLPGVVQTNWVVMLARRYFDLPPRFQSMSNMKFMRFILPGTCLALHLKYVAARSELVFEYREGNAICASGRMGFGFESGQ